MKLRPNAAAAVALGWVVAGVASAAARSAVAVAAGGPRSAAEVFRGGIGGGGRAGCDRRRLPERCRRQGRRLGFGGAGFRGPVGRQRCARRWWRLGLSQRLGRMGLGPAGRRGIRSRGNSWLLRLLLALGWFPICERLSAVLIYGYAPYSLRICGPLPMTGIPDLKSPAGASRTGSPTFCLLTSPSVIRAKT